VCLSGIRVNVDRGPEKGRARNSYHRDRVECNDSKTYLFLCLTRYGKMFLCYDARWVEKRYLPGLSKEGYWMG
jgi:hypothetical protein